MTKSDHERVIDAVEERFYEKGMLSGKSDIKEETGLSDHALNQVLDDLLGTALTEVYEGQGYPTIFATIQMANAITSHVGEPEWIEDYEFEAKSRLRDDVRDANEKISEYQVFELLLHSNGDPLEDGIETALQELGFEPDRTEDAEDFFFEDDGDFYIAEAKGKGGQVSKGDVNQLGGWVENKIDEGYSGKSLNGVIFHNAHRHQPPDERDDPLTEKAREYLAVYDFHHISTYELFQMAKEIKEFDGSADDKEELVNSLKHDFIDRISND